MRVKATHFIDTSILASLVFNDTYEKECLRYIKRVPKIYKGNISILVLGELYLSLLNNITDNLELTSTFQMINNIIQQLDFQYVTLEVLHYQCCISEIRKIDSRLDITDTKLLAEALGSDSAAFITIDQKILKSKNLNELIEIAHPDDMI
ncbi:hypothetical protein BK009_03345 [Methanobacterium subterraneum]|uniref:PIN domain-containing protein n=1 Tax=Methanobacterium subterraneum TaxID=59277 RepID=A0A2H4VNW2_9EURY|nr:hypothetical protein [Methanobacterium subterraneum]AUB59794.1 hypothetical protein BK009_03345 [Methanobacterium subterraneum]